MGNKNEIISERRGKTYAVPVSHFERRGSAMQKKGCRKDHAVNAQYSI